MRNSHIELADTTKMTERLFNGKQRNLRDKIIKNNLIDCIGVQPSVGSMVLSGHQHMAAIGDIVLADCRIENPK